MAGLTRERWLRLAVLGAYAALVILTLLVAPGGIAGLIRRVRDRTL